MQSLWEIRRTTEGAKLAGLCGGIATRFGIDPLLVRVAAIVLTLSGGLGAVLYAAGWLLLPRRGESITVLARHLPQSARIPRWAWLPIIAATGLLTMITVGQMMPVGTGPVIVIAVAWYVLVHRPRQRARSPRTLHGSGGSTASAVVTSPDATAAWQQQISLRQGGSAASWPGSPIGPRPDPMAGTEPRGLAAHLPPIVPTAVTMSHSDTASFFAHPDPAGLYQPRVTRRARTAVATPHRTRQLTRWTLIVGLVVLGGLGVLDGVGVLNIGLATYASAALLIVAVALVASAWTGRPRGLVAIAVILALLSVGSQTPSARSPGSSLELTGAASELDGDYRLDPGEYTVDMTEVSIDGAREIHVASDLGSIRLLLPAEGNYRVRASADVGEVQRPDATLSGTDVETRWTRIQDPDGPVLDLSVHISIGNVVVIDP